MIRNIMLSCAAAAAMSFFGVAATAAPAREVGDMTYVAIARCAGLAEGTGGDAAPFKAIIDQQSGPRSEEIVDKASEVRAEARRLAGDAGPEAKERLVHERDGVCRRYLQTS